MTTVQEKFVALERRKAEYKAWVEELAKASVEVFNEIGEGGMFQDEENIVYKMTVPNGKFIYYEKVSYNRTKRAGESRGSLSVTEARENGFLAT